jgi:hypothetical protein
VGRTLLPLGALAAVALLVFGGSLTVDAIDSLSETRVGATRTPVPGTRNVELEARRYTLFYEVGSSSVLEGDLDKLPIPPLEVTIRRGGDGTPLPLDDYGGSFTLYDGDRAAKAWRTVQVPEAGRYRIRAAGRPRALDLAVVLGKPVTRRVLRLVAGLAGIASGLGLLALLAAVEIAARFRRRSA